MFVDSVSLCELTHFESLLLNFENSLTKNTGPWRDKRCSRSQRLARAEGLETFFNELKITTSNLRCAISQPLGDSLTKYG